MNKISIIDWDSLEPLVPAYALVADVDLVIIRWQDSEEASVLYGRCLHRGALLSDGCIKGDNLICGLHNWDYSYRTGISSYNPSERLQRFSSWLQDGKVWVDEDEITSGMNAGTSALTSGSRGRAMGSPRSSATDSSSRRMY